MKEQIIEMLNDYLTDIYYLQRLESESGNQEGVEWYKEQEQRVKKLIKNIKNML